MEHTLSILPIAIPLVVACLAGILMVRAKMPPIVGYILAGAVLGPSGFSLIDDRESVEILAEIGVILLLFFLGADLSLRVFRRVWVLAVATTVVEIGGSLLVVYFGGSIAGLNAQEILLLGFSLALSSTAVVFSQLRQMNLARSRIARIAVAILLAQDLALAPMIVILQSVGTGEEAKILGLLWKVSLTLGLLVAFIVFFTRRRAVSLPFIGWLARHPDVAPLLGLTICVGFAGIAEVVGLSPAFGGFLGGLLVGNSRQRHLLMERTQPLQETLLVLFFLSIGLLVDIGFIFSNILSVLGLWVVVVVFKTGLNILALRVQGINWPESILVAFFLAQIGEFAFVLAGATRGAGSAGSELFQLIVSVTVLTLISTPYFADEAQHIARFLDRSVGFRRVFYVLLAHSRDRMRLVVFGPFLWIFRQVQKIFSKVISLRTGNHLRQKRASEVTPHTPDKPDSSTPENQPPKSSTQEASS